MSIIGSKRTSATIILFLSLAIPAVVPASALGQEAGKSAASDVRRELIGRYGELLMEKGVLDGRGQVIGSRLADMLDMAVSKGAVSRSALRM